MFEKYKEKFILKKIEAFQNLDGWLSGNEALGLYSIAAMQPRNAIVVEIGSWQGKSTYYISKGLKSGKVHAIDPFNADAGLDIGSEEEYHQKKGYSYQFHNDFEKINFLFIDGDHSIKGCQADFDLYPPKIVPGGFIAFHDYYEDRDELGSTYVIKNVVMKSDEFKFFKQYDTLWVARKV